jgi:transposase
MRRNIVPHSLASLTEIDLSPHRGMTVADVARRYRVSPERVRRWIARGELVGINTRDVRCGRPRWVITLEALADFESRRQAKSPPKKARQKKRTNFVDYYP